LPAQRTPRGYVSSKLLPPIDIQILEMFRSENEHLVGHEFIKALSKFKLSNVPPLPPSNYHESFEFEVIVVHLKEPIKR
jgi:hypothetical protein